MFKNLKIAMKIGIGFCGVVALAVGILAYVESQCGRIETIVESIVKDHNVKVRQCNRLLENLNVVARSLRNIALIESSDQRAAEAEIVRGVRDNQTAVLDSLDNSLQSPEGRRLFDKIGDVRKVYAPLQESILSLGAKGEIAQAKVVILGPYQKAQMEYMDLLQQLIRYQNRLSEEAGKEADDMASRVAFVLVVSGIGLVVLSALLAWFITRAIVRPIEQCVELAEQVAAGRVDQEVVADTTEETGKLKRAMAGMIEAIRRMSGDARMLSAAAVRGELATRADVSRHEGEFRAIVQGVNETLDSVVGPLNVAAKYVDEISKGNIPAKITDNYNGDFNSIKDNLNTCIDAVNALVADANYLSMAALEGRLQTRADVNRHQGDFRRIVQGVNDTLDAVIGPITEASQVLEKVAARDMTARVQGDYAGDLARIKVALNMAVDNLETALVQVSQATGQVAEASVQISSGSQSLAQGANEQASSLEEVSASLEQMSSMTRQSADNAVAAKQLAGEADSHARTGTEAMGRMSGAINRIKESSDQTAKIVKTIDEIAMQTNLLALNAAVEAARAGEAGRGFAVVAEEVRNLAQRSAQAAKNTADMIGESVRNAEEGVKISQEVSSSFEKIATSSKKVNDLIAEIAAASKEQAQGIKGVNDAVVQMDKVTQQNAANAEESASASEELSSQAEELQAMVAQFRLAGAREVAVKSPARGGKFRNIMAESRKMSLDAPRARKASVAVEPQDEPVLDEF